MHFRLSLFHKGLILVAVPLIFELISYAILADLFNKAQEEARQAEKARQISDTINVIVRDFYDMLTTIKSAAFARDPSLKARKDRMVGKALEDMRNVEELVKDDPYAKALMDEVQRRARQADQNLDAIRTAYENNDYEECARLQRSLNVALKKIISQELLSLAKREGEIGDRSPERQAYYRQEISQLLSYAIAFSVILTIILAVVVTRGITSRLSILADNSLRLARNDSLLPELKGQDEIAQVDQVFHTMAETLAQAIRTERALIDNASDVICSIDKSGRFASMSPASQKVFGYAPDELLGRHYVDLVDQRDSAHAVSSMDMLLTASNQEPFESRLVRKDGQVIDVVFSAYWSESAKTYFCVLHDITERKDAERMKQEVLAMVSHDLRTPLTAIRHLHEMLARGQAGALPEQAQRLVNRADAVSNRMLILINDLLEIERIKAGKMELCKAEIPAANLFDNCMQIVAPLAEEKSVKLEITDTDIDIYGDADRMVQVLVNLVSNAIKYSPSGGTVTMEARHEDDHVRVCIEDQGPGIPEGMRESIFNRFQKVRESDPSNIEGAGLGLAICKAIVELHGGAIWVECRNDETGSRFIFTVPVSRQAPLQQEDDENCADAVLEN